jgi:ATP-dependent RNA helicase MSS116
LRVQVAVGGNSKRAMLQKMQYEGCHLLVATPGRLNDLLTDPYSKVSAPDLNTLVLDEADRLLDAGFSKDIEDIVSLLPDRRDVDRQTLLFSATVPREVMHLVQRTLKPDFKFVQTVQKGELATHEKVPQKIVMVPGIENFLPGVLELAKREIAKANEAEAAGREAKPFKAIVYLNSAANVELSARVFEELKGEGGTFGKHPLYPAEVLEMHSRLTQERRTRISERFRRLKSGILFSTDVTARGMHFPHVTHVIQLGVPPNQEQYVHRIGRTGRADQTGEGWIFICDHDVPEARRRLRGLPISPDTSLEAAKLDMTRQAQLPSALAATLEQISNAVRMVDRETKSKAYMAGMGQGTGDAAQHVDAMNRWTKYGWGWPTPPRISRGMASKLGLPARLLNLDSDPFDRYGGEPDLLNGPSHSRQGRLDAMSGSRGSGGRMPDSFGRPPSRGFGGDRGRGFGGDRGDRGSRDFGGRGRDFGDRGREFGDRGRNSGRFSRSGPKDFGRGSKDIFSF